MKKILLASVVSLFAVVAFPVAASAAPAQTLVSGIVRQDGNPLPGATVTVKCESVTGTDTTDGTGSYLVEFAAADCPAGSTVTAVANKDGAAGQNSSTANQIGGTKLNVSVVDVDVALPEMSTIIGGVTAAAVGGGLLLMRRKQLGQN